MMRDKHTGILHINFGGAFFFSLFWGQGADNYPYRHQAVRKPKGTKLRRFIEISQHPSVRFLQFISMIWFHIWQTSAISILINIKN